MNTVLFLITECLEGIKIYLLIHYMTNVREKRGIRQLALLLGVIVAETVYNRLVGENLASYCVMALVIVNTLFDNRWYQNLIWFLWATSVIGLIDFFWSLFLQFFMEINGVPIDSMLKIDTAFCTIVTIFILGWIYAHVNHGRFTLPILYYVCFSAVTLINGLLLDIYVSGVRKQYAASDEIPVGVMVCICVCVIGFLSEMLAILILGSLNYIYKEREILQKEMIQAQKEHYKELELREMDTRRFRHDIEDHIHVIRQLLYEKKYEEAFKYMDRTDKIMHSLKRVSVGNSAVDAILSQYLSIANEKGIPLKTEGRLPSKIYIADYDLCTIVSNVLRNAITATTGDIIIQFRYDEDYIYMKEKNSCDYDVMIENTIPDTRKADKRNHGYGIRNIKQAVEKNGGTLTIYARQGEFHLSVILRNKEVR